MKYLLLFILASTCNSTDTPVNNDVMQVRVSETFTISIPSSIGTGYTWQLADSSSDYLVEVSKRYEKGKADTDGASGQDIFLLKAIKAGTTTVRFRYVRPWEKGRSDSEKSKSFTIKIE